MVDEIHITLLTPLSTQISVLYASLYHLMLCLYFLVGLHTFVKNLLPNFKALRSLSVEILRGVNTDGVRDFSSASESCKNLLEKMVSGRNGEGVKGVITKNEVHSNMVHSVRASFAWVWTLRHTDKNEDSRRSMRETGMRMNRERTLVIKKRIAHVKF